MPFIRLPRLKVIAVRNHIKSGLLDEYSELNQLVDWELLIGKLKSDQSFAE